MSSTIQTMKRDLSMLWRILIMIQFHWMLAVYLVIYFILSLVIWNYDPDIHDLSDALWFTFQTVTTIGYGDLIVNSVEGRILTVILSIYSVAIIAVFTGMIAGFYVELVKMKARKSAVRFMFELQNLPELSHEELVDLSNRAKEFLKNE